ncbi:laccase [Pterulicium gracile]|uniref:Laccase n=1 Tax=Pterulicium gracile TaxID=1884261 RepID=A0A5C3QTP7_9AGAR|nr:laccase [Pterula gracilis]
MGGRAALLASLLVAVYTCVMAELLPIVELPITNELIAPDNIQRMATLAGGTYPGKAIFGNKGDTFRVNVVNQLHDPSMWQSTTVHWHGIKQVGTFYEDGAAWITQCPIAANHSFMYEFPVPDQAGTFWYHSHFSTQLCDGLRGPFIVYDPDDPLKHLYDVDDESTIISLSDWYHSPSRGALKPMEIPPLPDSILINGKGRYPGTGWGLAANLSIVNVEYGKRYRLRIIQMACDADMIFSIDGHAFDIIEVEGTPTRPLTVDRLHIFSGQRYSAVLHANQPPDNYYIRALPFPGRVLTWNYERGANSAILRYKGALDREPSAISDEGQISSTRPFREKDLVPLDPIPVPGNPYPGGADVNINLVLDLDIHTGKYLQNGVTYVPPKAPVLLQILSGAKSAQELLPSESVYTLPLNKVVEVTIPGTSVDYGGPHPWHLHGHTFWVVRSAGTNATNYVDPIRRDTVDTGYGRDNITIRFVTDNSGPWFLHCHVDWHLELGMAVVFAEEPSLIAEKAPPTGWDELCPIYNSLTPDQLR